MEETVQQTLVCVAECVDRNAIVALVVLGGYTLFSSWVSTLKKGKWWEKVLHVLALNWGYLAKKEPQP